MLKKEIERFLNKKEIEQLEDYIKKYIHKCNNKEMQYINLEVEYVYFKETDRLIISRCKKIETNKTEIE